MQHVSFADVGFVSVNRARVNYYIQEKLLRNDGSGHFQYVCFVRVAKW